MKFYKTIISSLLLFNCSFVLQSQQTNLTTDVLVIGGGTGGTAAGIQSARLGVTTIIAEPTFMLGGMLTAAGVSCTDGNHELNSGMWQAFREALYQRYETTNLATGWISETCFEPHVADSIFKAWAAKETNLTVLYSCTFEKIIKGKNKVAGAVFKNKAGSFITVHAAVTIDATELGDVFAKAGTGYDLGMDAKTREEKEAGGKNNIIQDITWAAIVKDYGTGADKTITKPAGYKAENYYCSCTDAPCINGKPYNVNTQKMLDYAKLPNNKYMLNWPAHGNDSYLNVVEDSNEVRSQKYEEAKNRTLGFIYFIQTQLGMKNLGVATDELDSGMAIIPYNREGRRVKGMIRMNINHIKTPYNYTLYRTGIAVGDYPVDHHHGQYPGKVPSIQFPKIPSFNIPMGALIPATIDGLIVCEKGISVSNIVNGSTRLQPVVLLTGQAAGMLAAISIKEKKEVRNIPVREVQTGLLNLKCYIMPYVDVKPDNPYWQAIQRVGATGILKGVGKSEGWANKTYFHPDSTITVNEFEKGVHSLWKTYSIGKSGSDSLLTVKKAMQIITKNNEYLQKIQLEKIRTHWIETRDFSYFDGMSWGNELHLKQFNLERPVKRFELAVLIDYYTNAFEFNSTDIKGKTKTD